MRHIKYTGAHRDSSIAGAPQAAPSTHYPLDIRERIPQGQPMHCIDYPEALRWGALDLPMFGIGRDWSGARVDPPAAWSLARDPANLWFVAAHSAPARIHPAARPGRFTPDLWKYDVAELFIGAPGGGLYLELNLAPNGAWWSSLFEGPRKALPEGPVPEIVSYAELAPGGGWVAAAAIPLAYLREHVGFGESCTANTTFILNSPNQRFLSATDLGGREPDFHRPGQFPILGFIDSREVRAARQQAESRDQDDRGEAGL